MSVSAQERCFINGYSTVVSLKWKAALSRITIATRANAATDSIFVGIAIALG